MELQRHPTIQAELICPFCSRTFQAHKQTARHIRYCRTKAKDDMSSTRQRSCVACTKAKTRCSMNSPSCSRCAIKGLQCLYKASNKTSDLEVQGVPAEEHVSVFRQAEAAIAHNNLARQRASDSSVKPNLARRENSPRDSSTHIVAGNSFHSALPTDTWADLQSNARIGNSDGTAFPSGMLDLILSDPLSWNSPYDSLLPLLIYHFKDRVVLGCYYVVSISPSFVPLGTKTILEKRELKAGPCGSALSRAYCMSTLKSYPGMLHGNNGTLPPFIHVRSRPCLWTANSQSANDHVIALPEPLEICSSILQMYMARSPENVAFIWRTIQAESQRLNDEAYDAWTTLHSIQAMAIYIILGLLGDNSEYVIEEHILIDILSTTKRMANKYQPVGWMCNGEIYQDQVPVWEEWALAESRRRTAIILVIIIHLFNIEHGHGLPQCGGFSDLSLPCSKALWEAADQATWEIEYHKQYMQDSKSGQNLKTILTYKDLLLDLQDQNDSTSSSRVGGLSKWFLGMDDLGTLVSMAVSAL